jgi:hypothetical protein
MKVTLNETTAEKINSLTNDTVSAETVIDMAVDTLCWVKSSLEEGKTVMAAKSSADGWVEEEFYPAAEVLNELYNGNTDAAETPAEATAE